jgi:hypothetical protein
MTPIRPHRLRILHVSDLHLKGELGRRDLIPLHLLAAFEVAQTHGGLHSGSGSDEEVSACLDVLDDGFCEARCGNCSYVLSTGFGLPLSGVPANQIQGYPKGTQGPYQIGVDGQLAAHRDNYGRLGSSAAGSRPSSSSSVWPDGKAWRRPGRQNAPVASVLSRSWPSRSGRMRGRRRGRRSSPPGSPTPSAASRSSTPSSTNSSSAQSPVTRRPATAWPRAPSRPT